MITVSTSKLMAFAAILAAGTSLLATSAKASEILWTATDGSATADMTFTPNGLNTDIKIVLTNTTPAASTASAGNLLTGLNIDFAPPTALSISSQSAAHEVSLAGTTPTVATLLSAGPYNPDWQVSNASPDDKLWFVGFGAGGIPIIGSYDASNQYIHGNNSLVSGPHPLDIYQTATFNMSAAGSIDDTNVAGVTFLFNTAASTQVPGTTDGGGSGRTPEPASLGILGLGAMSLLTRKRRA